MKKGGIYAILISIIVGVIVTLVADSIQKLPLGCIIKKCGKWSYENFTSLMNTNIKLYWVLIFAITAFLLKWVWNKIEIRTTSESQCRFKISDYRQEYYHGILWKFSWQKAGSKWMLSDLTACCPYDKTPLYKNQCPMCGKYFLNSLDDNEFDIRERAKILIVENANRLSRGEQQNPLS